MKILLVKPSPILETVRKVHRLILLEPLEFGYLAAAAGPAHEIYVLDLRLEKNPNKVFLQTLSGFKPDLIGISGYTHEAHIVKKLARITRSVLPSARVIIGGHHATVFPEDYDIDCIDAVVRGEGCAPFASLVEAAEAGQSFKEIPNALVPGSFDGSIDELPLYPDLADVPVPRRDLWEKHRYRCVWASEHHEPWKPLFPPVSVVRSSFGCTMECSFCVVPRLCGRQHMTRPADMVADEIESLETDHIYFCDDEMFLESRHAMELAAALDKRGVRKHYFSWARSTTVNRSPEVFRTWRRLGLDAVFLGFEATSDQELKDFSKHSSVQENERALATLKEMGIAVQAGFMVRPDFTTDDFERLKQYVEKMPSVQVTFTVFTPSPRSPAWEQQKDSFVADPIRLHDCMHPLTPTVMPLQEFFSRFSELVRLGPRKNPLRAPGNRLRPWDIARIWWAGETYASALHNAYLDYPENPWKVNNE